MKRIISLAILLIAIPTLVIAATASSNKSVQGIFHSYIYTTVTDGNCVNLPDSDIYWAFPTNTQVSATATYLSVLNLSNLPNPSPGYVPTTGGVARYRFETSATLEKVIFFIVK